MARTHVESPANSPARLAPLLVLLATLLAYSNAISTAFVLDDIYWIESGMRDYTAERLLLEASQNRRWLTRVTLACNYFADRSLGGDGFRTGGYKAVNVLIHASAALTLYALVRRAIDRPLFSDRVRRGSPWIAMAVALLWAVHPLQTQAVTYVIQRSECLMALFFLLSLYAYLKAGDRDRDGRRAWPWNAVALVCALASAWCKEVAVVLPMIALLLDRAILGGPFAVMLRRRVWVLAAMALAVASPFLLVGTRDLQADHLAAQGAMVTAGLEIPHLGPWQYLLAQSTAIVHYLKLCAWPHTLALDYTGWPVPQSLNEVIGPAAIALMLVIATLWAWIRKPWVGLLGAGFFIVLAPTSSVIPITDIVMEHRMYLPLASLSAIAVAVACSLTFRVGDNTPMARLRVSRRFLVASVLLTVVTLGLGARTLARNRDYTTAATLYAANTRATPNNPRAWRNLASELVFSQRVVESVSALERCVELAPFDVDAQRALGAAYLETGRAHDALPRLRGVLTMIEQDRAKGDVAGDAYRAKVPMVHYLIGRSYEALGAPIDAEREYRASLSQFQGAAEVHLALARLLEAQGRDAEAIEAYGPVIAGAQVPIDVIRRVVWLIATGQLENRDLALMERFCAALRPQALRSGDAALLDTVAAADARAGRYESAVANGVLARDTAAALGLSPLAEAIQIRVIAYQSRQPWTRPIAASRPSTPSTFPSSQPTNLSPARSHP